MQAPSELGHQHLLQGWLNCCFWNHKWWCERAFLINFLDAHFLLSFCSRHLPTGSLRGLHWQACSFQPCAALAFCYMGLAVWPAFSRCSGIPVLFSEHSPYTHTHAHTRIFSCVEMRKVSYQLQVNDEYHCQTLQNGIPSNGDGRLPHRDCTGEYDSFFNPVIKAFAVQSRWNNNVILALNAHLYLSVSINKMVGEMKADLLSPTH